MLIPKLKEPDLNPNVVINIVATIGELVQVRGQIFQTSRTPSENVGGGKDRPTNYVIYL